MREFLRSIKAILPQKPAATILDLTAEDAARACFAEKQQRLVRTLADTFRQLKETEDRLVEATHDLGILLEFVDRIDADGIDFLPEQAVATMGTNLALRVAAHRCKKAISEQTVNARKNKSVATGD